MQEIQELSAQALASHLEGLEALDRQALQECRVCCGQKVLLNTRNLRLKLPRKLQDWDVGPFKVLKQVGPTAYKLDLFYSSTLKMIHPGLHFSPLRDFEDNGLRLQPPPVEVDG